MCRLKNIFIILVVTLVAIMPVGCSAIETTTKVVNGKIYDIYEVKPKETVYSISKKLGITQDELKKHNPQVADGLKKGELLYFPQGVIKDGSDYKTHKIKRGESLYSLSKKYDTTVDELLKLNPRLSKDKYKTGTVILIPQKSRKNDKKEKEPENEVVATDTMTVDSIIREKDDVIDVAVILPFMLSNPTMSKNAKLKTEFYKGFLMALEKNKNKKINVYAYDSAESLDTVKSILKNQELRNIDIFIAPEDDNQLAEIARYAQQNQSQVLNVFSTKNELYKENPYVINVNIPQELMYEEAVDAYMKQLKGSLPVILVNKSGAKDKSAFVEKVKNAMIEKNIDYTELEYNHELTIDTLSKLNEPGKYAFILESSKRDELNNVITAIDKFQKDSIANHEVKLLGYPDWIIIKGTLADKLHQFNATIYSRFYYNENSADLKDFETEFHGWYGDDMISAMPAQGVLGYDIGMFIFKNKGVVKDGDKRNGIQTDIKLGNISDESGLVNKSITIIRFTPDGDIIKID